MKPLSWGRWRACHPTLSLVVLLLLGTLPSPVESFVVVARQGHTTAPTPRLWQSPSSDDDKVVSPPRAAVLGKKQGVYTRPSAAIERGSGFFIPGLEGPKIRIAVGLLLLTTTVGNHAFMVLSSDASSTSSPGNTLAEGLAVVYSGLALVQAGVEGVQESQGRIQIGNTQQEKTSSSSSKTQALPTAKPPATSVEQAWMDAASAGDESWRERVAWSAQSILALTGATHVLLLGPRGVVYRVGASDDNALSSVRTDSNDDDDVARAVAALQETMQASSSGRVALPRSHPAVQILVPPQQECVVVQRIDPQWSWVVTSPESLASTLTQRDLQWMGPLADYVQLPSSSL
jgi:hypothetical protein